MEKRTWPYWRNRSGDVEIVGLGETATRKPNGQIKRKKDPMSKTRRRRLPRAVVRVQYRQGEDGWVIAECPDLPGCMSQGRTRDEARKNISNAIEGWMLAQEDLGLPSPVSELLEVP